MSRPVSKEAHSSFFLQPHPMHADLWLNEIGLKIWDLALSLSPSHKDILILMRERQAEVWLQVSCSIEANGMAWRELVSPFSFLVNMIAAESFHILSLDEAGRRSLLTVPVSIQHTRETCQQQVR